MGSIMTAKFWRWHEEVEDKKIAIQLATLLYFLYACELFWLDQNTLIELQYL